MIVTQSTAAAMGIDVTALYDISLTVSGLYITALLAGAIKFGITLVSLLRGSSKGVDQNASKDAREKTWKKIRKVVIMLAWIVPGASLYMISLLVYMIAGIRNDVSKWIVMQYVFRSLESVIIWGICSCLATRDKAGGPKAGLASQRSLSTTSTSLSPSTKNFFSKSMSGIGAGSGDRHIGVIKEAQEEHALNEDTIETHVV